MMVENRGRQYSDKRADYIKDYLKEKTDHIGMTVPKGTKDRWRAAAEAQGVSMTKYVCEAVDRRIAADEMFGSTTGGGATTTRARGDDN